MAATSSLIQLQSFNAHDLIFNERETKNILIFFFPSGESLIESTIINNRIREFAQAILFEAIERTDAMGWVHALFTATATLGRGMRGILKKAAKELDRQERTEGKIYESIRRFISINFRSTADSLLRGIPGAQIPSLPFLAPSSPGRLAEVLWG